MRVYTYIYMCLCMYMYMNESIYIHVYPNVSSYIRAKFPSLIISEILYYSDILVGIYPQQTYVSGYVYT